MATTKIILLPVMGYERKLTEKHEDAEFASHEEARKVFGDDAGIVELTTFMDMCNDQEITIEEYWVGYIKIKD
jgi:hypothetical protein